MKLILFIAVMLIGVVAYSQGDNDSLKLNQNAVYQRPFIQKNSARTAVGGYLEANTNFIYQDGVSDGFSMEMRRFNLFLYSSINSRIRFLSELEFEHGTEEISLETAFLDFKMSQALNFRAGIVLPAIGVFNANHDSPNWEFIDRPISSTRLIPSTLSEVGFGFHGAAYSSGLVYTYQVFIVNGLADGVTQNPEGRTVMARGKSNEMFAEDNNGQPMYNFRGSIAKRNIGELGFSYYGGVYNVFQQEDLQIDKKRALHLIAVDWFGNVKKMQIKGEYVFAAIDVRSDLQPLYAQRQKAGFMDLIYPIRKKKMLRFSKAVLNASLRLEHYDLNIGKFKSTSGKIGEEGWRIGLGIGFRPVPGTTIRINYHYSKENDILSNPAAISGGYQVGFASYF
jgi:hypothetical protein